MQSPPTSGGPVSGWLVPIGGALAAPEILDTFVALCGGARARIAIIPTASREAHVGEQYAAAFARHGVREARPVPFSRRSDCDDRDWLERLAMADGVFMTGGDQLRLSTIMGGTPASALVRRRFAEGMHVAGTSAGASFLSEHMIARGDEGATPRAGMVTLAAGLGLTNRLIIDQHFRERDRLGRLLTALAYNPFCLGLGVDEDTAAFIAPDGTLTVRGSGGVTVIDPSEVSHSSIADAEPGERVTMLDVRVHVLGDGARYDLTARVATPREAPPTANPTDGTGA